MSMLCETYEEYEARELLKRVGQGNPFGPTVGEVIGSKKDSRIGRRVQHVDDGGWGRVSDVQGGLLCVRWDDGTTDSHTKNLLRFP